MFKIHALRFVKCAAVLLLIIPGPEAGYRYAVDGLSFGNACLNGHNVGRYPEILKGLRGFDFQVVG